MQIGRPTSVQTIAVPTEEMCRGEQNDTAYKSVYIIFHQCRKLITSEQDCFVLTENAQIT